MGELIVTYTDAPAAYDGFGTKTLALAGRSRAGVVRKVGTPAEHVEWQRSRYVSGGRYITAAEGEQWGRVCGEVDPLGREDRLAGAAPFLLAALEMAADTWLYPDAGDCEEKRRVYRQAREAIALAKGA